MATILEIDAQAEVSAAAGDLRGLGDAARDLGGDLDAAGSKANETGDRLAAVGEGSDALASKSSQATGALGALAGGLEAVGLEQYAGALQGAAIATDVMSGAGDALNLVAETAAGRWIVTTAKTVAHTVAVGAQATATAAMTVAQGALNVVMSLNPAAIVVITILALVAGIILAYKHSETFREIVQKVFEAAAAYVGIYIDVIKLVIGIFQDLPGIAQDVWGMVSDAIGDRIDDITGFVTDLYDGVTSGADRIKDTVSSAFSTMFAPINTAIGWVEDLINKLSNIHFPDLPGNPFGRGIGDNTGGKPTTPDTGINNASQPVLLAIDLSVSPRDKDAATRDLVDSMREYFARRGQILDLTTPATP